MIKTYGILLNYEQETAFLDKKKLSNTLEQIWKSKTSPNSKPILPIVFFTCLTASGKGEKLNEDFFSTLFFHCSGDKRSSKYKRVLSLVKDLTDCQEFQPRVFPILADTEPRRTWGWNVSQSDITFLCRRMTKKAAMALPPEWVVTLWSEIEERLDNGWGSYLALPAKNSASNYLRELEEAYRPGKHRLLIEQERKYFTQQKEYNFAFDPNGLAIRRVAAYAHEAKLLCCYFGPAILLQDDFPVKQKDKLYRPELGEYSPTIIHPFTH
ncbi:MAG: hypothetical protein NUV82_00765 [Candidatus Komeilibacteria bacterium]|nr:hypothetical protein [Candidatus Komeilibacteria bacterium]